MDIFLWNQSPEALKDSDGHLIAFEDSHVHLIAEACDRQMQEDVAPAYGLQPSPRVSFVPQTIEREQLPGNCLVIIFAEDPPAAAAYARIAGREDRPAAAAAVASREDRPAAAAAVAGIENPPAAAAAAARVASRMTDGPITRELDDSGRNFARVYPGTILANKGTILTGPHSISAATSHECIEATYDRNLAWWAWNVSAQKVVAAEVCDPVEEDAYTKNVEGRGVAVSNFVYPAWFDAGAPAGSRFDQMQRLHAPFSYSDGGYLIVYDPACPDDDVHVEPKDHVSWGWNVKVKEEGFARTRVRLVWRGDRLVWVNE